MAPGRGKSAVQSVNMSEEAVESPSTSAAESESTCPRFAFRLRALGALMYHKKRRKKCAVLDLEPDRIYTIGRSRGRCDIVFSDNRISRKHCQICVDSSGTEVHLFEGARLRKRNGRGDERMDDAGGGASALKIRHNSQKSHLSGVSLTSGDGDHSYSEESSMEESSKSRAPLKLIYLDGKQLPRGGHRMLNPGSEVSLVACTKDGCPVGDLAFGEVSGFKVERRPICLERIQKVTSKVGSRSQAAGRDTEDATTNSSGKRLLPELRVEREIEAGDARRLSADRAPCNLNEGGGSRGRTRRRKVTKSRPACSKQDEDLGTISREQLCTATCQFLTAQQCARGANGGGKTPKTLLSMTQKIKATLISGPQRGRHRSQGEVISCNTGAESGRLGQTESDLFIAPVDDIRTSITTSTSSVCKGHDPGRSAPRTIATSDPQLRDEAKKVQTPTLKVSIAELEAVCAPAASVSFEDSEPHAEKNRLEENLSKDPTGLASEIGSAEEGNSRFLKRSTSEEEAADSKLRCSGSGLLLNRLASVATVQGVSDGSVSLEELLHPVHELQGILAATLTSDVPWFLSSQNIPQSLPVTIVGHDRALPPGVSRTAVPFPSWPHVQLIFPTFSDSIYIGCHHPKLFLLPRRTSIRVIITSANLLETQWRHVTNSVWWQDFPRKAFGGFDSLFSTSPNGGDFVHQLSTFVASLVRGVESAAHWAVDLALYDFRRAEAVLVTSIPGLHRCPPPPISTEIDRKSTLGVVRSEIVGVWHHFNPSVDPTGQLVRLLATILSDNRQDKEGLLAVQLQRVTNLQEDPNAVAVIVSGSSASLYIGFLPRATAQWISIQWDTGMCTFSAFLWPQQLLRIASTTSKESVELLIYAFQGPMFSRISATQVTSSQKAAMASLLHSIDRLHGLWRLNQVLSQYKWPDEAETDFFVGSSSIGTSLDAAYFASFAAAAGKKVHFTSILPESDSQWASWTTRDEGKNPSIGLVYPTIERVKVAKSELRNHRAILQFAEATWERIQPAGILHDAVPFPSEREGIPMHTKVVHRRFLDSHAGIPYGWIYSGSHNFSAAAWGLPCFKSLHCCSHKRHGLGSLLQIGNYEIGLLFIEPPPHCSPQSSSKSGALNAGSTADSGQGSGDLKQTREKMGIDKYVLPFKTPPPRYKDVDRPATRKALYDLGAQLRYDAFFAGAFTGGNEETDLEAYDSDVDSSVEDVEAILNAESTPSLEDIDYSESLWSQIESRLTAPGNVTSGT